MTRAVATDNKEVILAARSPVASPVDDAVAGPLPRMRPVCLDLAMINALVVGRG